MRFNICCWKTSEEFFYDPERRYTQGAEGTTYYTAKKWLIFQSICSSVTQYCLFEINWSKSK